MILDKMNNLSLYGIPSELVSLVQQFAAKAVKEKLEEGRYALKGDDVFALVQSYNTKAHEDCQLESHIIYTDIQYILSGTEAMDYCAVDGLEITEDKRSDKDVIFYTKPSLLTQCIVSEGDFALFMPQDGHAPGKMIDDPKAVNKIVFKINSKLLN